MVQKLILAILFSLAANVVAEWILAKDLRQPFSTLTQVKQMLRIMRWITCIIATLIVAAVTASPLHLITFSLFSVSAATDLETKFLPPDGFTYGSVLLGLRVCFGVGGWDGLRDGLLAQAACFALWTLGVALFNLCDAGDIKLAMQFGAACGSLLNVGLALLVVWAVACGVVLMAVTVGLHTMPLRKALHYAATLHPPQGPLLWCGLLAVLLLRSLMRIML